MIPKSEIENGCQAHQPHNTGMDTGWGRFEEFWPTAAAAAWWKQTGPVDDNKSQTRHKECQVRTSTNTSVLHEFIN